MFGENAHSILLFLAESKPQLAGEIMGLLPQIRQLTAEILQKTSVDTAEVNDNLQATKAWLDKNKFGGFGMREALDKSTQTQGVESTIVRRGKKERKHGRAREHFFPLRLNSSNENQYGKLPDIHTNVAAWLENRGKENIDPLHYNNIENIVLVSAQILNAIKKSSNIEEFIYKCEMYLAFIGFVYDSGATIETDMQRFLLESLPESSEFVKQLGELPTVMLDKMKSLKGLTMCISSEVLAYAVGEGLLKVAGMEKEEWSQGDLEAAQRKLMTTEGWSEFAITNLQPDQQVTVNWLGSYCPKFLEPLEATSEGLRLKDNDLQLIRNNRS